MKNIIEVLHRADVDILEELQNDSRVTVSELAGRINLSDSPCWRRWKKLEEEGYITGYNATLDRKKLGLQVIGFSQIRLNSHHPIDTEKFETAIQEFNWVMTCFCITGEADFIVQIVASDLDQYYERVSELRRLPYVWSIQSSIAIKEVKNTNQFPIRNLS
ncbi:Lrp/AsnC family transcriptional regulator [uncultured Vibrio sp.]|uniref:Lrp/AsnC family transcriptional regulator n=1 Tax=uncultured Vibrio sp. TaxID=114054 RepID=UPI002602E68A|nr:Lrp/AsnC family transcriptional regulator [uncultured Vibrio sp.]